MGGPRSEGRRQEGTDGMERDEPFTGADPGDSGQESTAQHGDGRGAVSRVIQTAVKIGQMCGERRFWELLQFEVQKGVGQCWVICPRWTGPHPWRPRQGEPEPGEKARGSRALPRRRSSTASSFRDRGRTVK